MMIRTAISIGLVGAGLTLSATPALADILILQSSGPSAGAYPAGRRVPNGTTIRLRQRDRMLLLEAGRTRRLTGPARYNVGAVRTAGQTSIWGHRSQRWVSAAVRNAGAIEARRLADLTEQAQDAAAAGDYRRSETLLRDAERSNFFNRAQCRLVWNLRVSNYLAESRPLPQRARLDPCRDLPTTPPANPQTLTREDRQDLAALERQTQELDRDWAGLIASFPAGN